MGRCCAVSILVSLLGLTAGCQLIQRDNLASPTADHSPGTPSPIELPPEKTAKVCMATAEAMEKDGKDIEAISLYEKARQNGANKQHIARHLAVLYERQGDFSHALDEYKQLLQRNARNADLLNDVGYCYYKMSLFSPTQDSWAEAEKHLRQALAINPNHARAWINLGMTLAQTQRAAESLEAFAKVVSPAQAHCNLAFILTTQGKFDDAKAAYRQALDQEPDLGLARAALDKLEKAGAPAAAAPIPNTAPRPDIAPGGQGTAVNVDNSAAKQASLP